MVSTGMCSNWRKQTLSSVLDRGCGDKDGFPALFGSNQIAGMD